MVGSPSDVAIVRGRADNGASLTIAFTRVQRYLRSSLWFVPALASVITFLLAKVLVAIDRRIDEDMSAWFLFGGEADSARELLSTITSSMMTFTGLVFSITILVLQLASSQFSPRVVRTFLEDRQTHTAMAVFVSTFVFTMLLLVEVRSAEPDHPAFVPRLSLFAAFVFVLVSVGVFMQFIHHMAHSVRAITIIKRIGTDTRRSMRVMYPEEILETAPPSLSPPEEPPAMVPNESRGGVFSAVDEDGLIEIAEAYDAVVALVPMPGDFVSRGAPLFRVWGGEIPPGLAETVLIEEERTLHQDPAFGFRQLVDIAERALSPAVNDPSTAVQALDELHDLLRALATRCFPSPMRADSSGQLRLILPRPDWEAYVHLALDEIRQYGAGSVQVLRRMRALILDCHAIAPESRRPPLEAQLGLLDEALERGFPSRHEAQIAEAPSVQGHGQQ
jgi:uncharacterized membrane protein